MEADALLWRPLKGTVKEISISNLVSLSDKEDLGFLSRCHLSTMVALLLRHGPLFSLTKGPLVFSAVTPIMMIVISTLFYLSQNKRNTVYSLSFSFSLLCKALEL